MAEYTYECEECGCEFVFKEHRETPFKELHYAQDIESGKLQFACDGNFYRKWKPPSIIIKDYSQESFYPKTHKEWIMIIGVIYADSSSELNVVEKIKKNVEAYKEKYGVVPNKCHINKDTYENNEEELKQLNIIEVIPDKLILKNNFWIGNDRISSKEYSEIKLKIYQDKNFE